MQESDYEKLGVFYLGREYDLASRTLAPTPLLYDSRDLVTHALCVGMTGSGKTGLCIGILEEAAIDGIPSIIIDPKGDLANLLLTFPELRAEDFAGWINPDDAARKGLSPDEYARQQADLWRKGLADWDQSPARIARLRQSAQFTVFTPGSSAGTPVSILKGFAAPPASLREDVELLGDQVSTAVSGLLGLVGIDADPMQSREHILLSAILRDNWQKGRDLDLAGLISQVQRPPLERVGVMDVESFYPPKERFELAMRLNNLLAAPGFEAWLAGDPLDVGALLRTAGGKPRVSIFSIAHLSDAERMFFVTLLLNQVVGWTRSQGGTTSLRAILYMDEIFGYFPPIANPPSKQPLLTLLKQARAYGVGVVLATQNPVDLDYKGLSNCGTWFIGRLQTERDKQRVLEGLEGAAAGGPAFDRSAMEQTLAGLGSRIFLMNNVHDEAPVVFQTRWALSYLAGPLTRQQIRTLKDAAAPEQPETPTAATPTPAIDAASKSQPAAPAQKPDVSAARPMLPPEINQAFLPVRVPAPSADAQLQYRPAVLGTADVFFADSKLDISGQQRLSLLAEVSEGPVTIDWTRATAAAIDESALAGEPQDGAAFAPLPSALVKAFDATAKDFPKAAARAARLDLWRSPSLRLVSRPGEDERAFRSRLAQAAHEQRDALADKLRAKFEPKAQRLQDRLRRAQQKIHAQEQQASSARWNTAVSVGSAVLGAVLGRRRLGAGTVGRAATAARGAKRAAREAQDVAGAREDAAALEREIRDLDAEFHRALAEAHASINPATEPLEPVQVRPQRGGVTVRLVALAWTPWWQAGSAAVPAYA